MKDRLVLPSWLRSSAKRGFFRGLRWLRRDEQLLGRISTQGWIPILNLHSVSPHSNRYWPPLHPWAFSRLLSRLVMAFDLRVLGDLTRPSSRPIAVLSFDDGYRDFLEYAAPVLSQHSVRANLNVITGGIESGQVPWNVALYDFLEGASRAEIARLKIAGFEGLLEGDDDDSKARYGARLSRYLKLRPREERELLLRELGPVLRMARPTRSMLTAEELRQLDRVHEIGSHSHTHESMGFESQEFFVHDLEQTIGFFDRELGRHPTIYAFPNGSYRAEQVELLHRRGFTGVLLVDEAFANAQSPYPRLSVHGNSMSELWLRSLGYQARSGA